MELTLPPVFSLELLPEGRDPLAVASAAARGGVIDGHVIAVEVPDRLSFAVMLAPEDTLARSLQVGPVAMVAMADALGSLLPAAIPVLFHWPDVIEVNSGEVGRMRIAADTAHPARPEWLVLGFDLDVLSPPDMEFGHERKRTTLFEEGAVDVTPPVVLEAFCRYLAVWVARWQDGGFETVRSVWNGRCVEAADRLDAKGRTADGRMARDRLVTAFPA